MQLLIRPKRLGVLVYNDVEVLDFCAPYEVFTIAGFQVFTVAQTLEPIVSCNGLSINPQYDFNRCPKTDILVVPGGPGVLGGEIANPKLLHWIKSRASYAELVVSVCTGTLLLAKAELLEHMEITTHHEHFHTLRDFAPSSAVIREGIRYADNGKIVTAAGVSAGLDVSLHIVERLYGREHALKTARTMEYRSNEYDW